MSARAAAVGIGYQLWLRSRWLLLACVGGALALALAVHLAPSAMAARAVSALGAIPIGFAAVTLVAIFTYSGDMSATESAFPRHMMVLPLSSRALALAPLLYGAGCMAALWWIVGRLVLIPAGWAVPILWPMAMLAAITTWLQATSWMPFWLPFARVAACIAGLFAICGFAVVAQTFRFSETVLIGGLVSAMGLTMPAAIAGVARARRGQGTLPSWIALPQRVRMNTFTRRPFASPQGAQIWLELRRNCSILPVFILPLPLLTLLAGLWPGHRNQPAPLYLGGLVVPVQLIWAAACLLMPPFMAAAMGPNLGKVDAWGKGRKMLSFVAVRPMADATLISAKLKASALTVGATWALTLALLAAAWALPHSYSRDESILHLLAVHATARRATIAALVLAFLVLETWLNAIQSFSISLYGRAWLQNAVQFSVIGAFIALGGLAYWTWQHPHALPDVLRGCKIAAWVLVGAKIVLAGMIIRSTRRCGAATPRQLVRWTALWLLLLAAEFTAILWLAPRSRPYGLTLASGLVLSLSYNRLIATPLAWHHNRHQ